MVIGDSNGDATDISVFRNGLWLVDLNGDVLRVYVLTSLSCGFLFAPLYLFPSS